MTCRNDCFVWGASKQASTIELDASEFSLGRWVGLAAIEEEVNMTTARGTCGADKRATMISFDDVWFPWILLACMAVVRAILHLFFLWRPREGEEPRRERWPVVGRGGRWPARNRPACHSPS